MLGEKKGRMENTMLFAMVCARGDVSDKNNGNDDSGEGGTKEMVQMIGDDSDIDSANDGDDSEPLTWMA